MPSKQADTAQADLRSAPHRVRPPVKATAHPDAIIDRTDPKKRLASLGRDRLGRLPVLSRLGAGGLSRRCRPDAERPPGGDRGDRGHRLGSELGAAAGTELRFVPGHAGRDAADIRNLGTAQPKRIVRARLFLFRGVSLRRARRHGE